MDCAHNPAGVKSFIRFLDQHRIRNIDLTFGVLDTKNWQEMVGLLKPYVSHWRLVLPDSERALPLEQVREEINLSGTDIRVSLYGNDYDRLIHDIIDEGEGEERFVTGSMYMVGRLRNMLGIAVKPLWPSVL
jgi:folylpolyglutamate synthase/dihydropteroate synthase